MSIQKAAIAALNFPGLGFMETPPALTVETTPLMQTHPLKPLLDGQFTRDGFAYHRLRDGSAPRIGLGAVGHHFARGEMMQIGNAIVTFTHPENPLLLDQSAEPSVAPPKDEVIFAATAPFFPLHAGAYLLTDTESGEILDLLKSLGRCIFVIQGVLSTLTVQCVQIASPDHRDFSQVPQVATTFTGSVATMVGLYLPEVDPQINVEGPHLHALVHSNAATGTLEGVLEAISFSSDHIRGGGHVRGFDVQHAFLWYQPLEADISIIQNT